MGGCMRNAHDRSSHKAPRAVGGKNYSVARRDYAAVERVATLPFTVAGSGSVCQCARVRVLRRGLGMGGRHAERSRSISRVARLPLTVAGSGSVCQCARVRVLRRGVGMGGCHAERSRSISRVARLPLPMAGEGWGEGRRRRGAPSPQPPHPPPDIHHHVDRAIVVEPLRPVQRVLLELLQQRHRHEPQQ